MSTGTSTLWMGELDAQMDEYFIKESFAMMGIHPINVKVIRDRISGMPKGYGFVEFEDQQLAEHALNTCNGRPVPNASQYLPQKTFKLNHATSNGGNRSFYNNPNSSTFSMFVGDLTSEVDDSVLYQAFNTRYPSVKAAKVVMDQQSGMSKGFGFVRFENENEYQNALVDMQNSLGIGCKPIRVGVATPKVQQSFGGPRNYYYQGVDAACY